MGTWIYSSDFLSLWNKYHFGWKEILDSRTAPFNLESHILKIEYFWKDVSDMLIIRNSENKHYLNGKKTKFPFCAFQNFLKIFLSLKSLKNKKMEKIFFIKKWSWHQESFWGCLVFCLEISISDLEKKRFLASASLWNFVAN